MKKYQGFSVVGRCRQPAGGRTYGLFTMRYGLMQLYEFAREKYEYEKDMGLENCFKGINELVRLESVFAIIHSDKWKTRSGHFKGWNLIVECTRAMKAMPDEKDLVKKDEMMSDLSVKLSQLLLRDMAEL